MDRPAATSSYLRVLGATVLVVALGATAVNALIDPYRLFGTPEIRGLSRVKPASAERMRVAKPFMADRLHAATVIGGNSRPELGLNPLSACWPATATPVFNAGVPGASFRLQTEFAMHAGATARQMLHGVDFLDFTTTGAVAPGAEPARSPEQRRLSVPGRLPDDTSFWLQRTQDHLTSLFSLTALGDSVLTVASQRDPYASTRTAEGFNPGADYVGIVRHEGQSVLFAQKLREFSGQLERARMLEHVDGGSGTSFEALRQLIAWCREHDVKLTLFINPYHAQYFQAIRDSGKWPMFEQWKRAVSEIAEEGGVPLWDFNTMDAYATEAPPPPGDRRTVLRWFWEPAHYRPELGELMLARMLGQDCAGGPWPPLGTRLDAGNVDAQLAELRARVAETSAR